MENGGFDSATLAELQKLIAANFAGRDDLAAAAVSLEDEAASNACRTLATHLADHAAELQQLVLANGSEPVGPGDQAPAAAVLFRVVKANRGAAGVVATARRSEQGVRLDYDCAIDTTAANGNAQETLKRHRDDVRFGEHLLRTIEERQVA